jgi:hypothetical protein
MTQVFETWKVGAAPTSPANALVIYIPGMDEQTVRFCPRAPSLLP